MSAGRDPASGSQLRPGLDPLPDDYGTFFSQIHRLRSRIRCQIHVLIRNFVHFFTLIHCLIHSLIQFQPLWYYRMSRSGFDTIHRAADGRVY